MDHPLDGAKAKRDRAVEHLATLHEASDAFFEGEPYEVTVKFEADADCQVARVHIRDDPPRHMSLVVGDLLHNLRSALDHLAWQAARRHHSAQELLKVRTKISFPVTQAPKEFAAHGFLGFINEDARAFFERFQPYKGPDGPQRHWLARLNRLWNADKHRVLHGAFSAMEISHLSLQPAAIIMEQLDAVRVEITVKHGDGVKDGTKIGEVHFAPLPGHANLAHYPPTIATKVDVKRQPTVQIAFGTGRENITLLGLGNLCATVGRVLRFAEPLFKTG